MSHGRCGFLVSRLWKAGLVLVLAVGLLLPAGNVVVSLSASNGAETGELSVVTEPAGASVFVDGQLAGSTPLNLKGVAVGEHRVRVAKTGYLENLRVVTVGGGKPAVVKVNLTANGSARESVAAPGGGGKKLLLIGLGAVAVGAGVYFLTNKNEAPGIPAITVVPASGNGMAGITNYSFTAAATDPDGDDLTYTWAFSDGGTATGATVTKVFAAVGSPTATVTASDGKKSSTATSTLVISPNMTATWTGGRELQFGCGINWNITQTGTNLTGSMIFVSGCTGTLTGVTGTVSGTTHPTNVSLQSPNFSFNAGGTIFPNLNMAFTGTTNAAGTTMTGNLRLRQTSSTFDQSYAATYTR